MADAPHDFVEDGAPPPDFAPDDPNSVMNPNPVSSRLREIGKTIGRYDPTIPSNMGRVGPPIAGAATVIGGGLAGGPAGAIAGAGAAPYVKAGVSKALGGNPSMPTWQDALKSAATQAVFEGAGKLLSVSGAPAQAARMEGLPPEFRTVKQLNQAVRNREFYKTFNLSDSEIDAAMANPKEAQAVLNDSIDRTQKIKQTFQDTADSTRAKFNQRYKDAYGKFADESVDVAPVQKMFDAASKIGGEHELTPSWKAFLQRKANELAGEDVETVARPGDIIKRGKMANMEPGMRAQFEAQVRGITDNQQLMKIADEARVAAANKISSRTFQDLRDVRTELFENKPTNGTNLDQKAYAQLQDGLTKHIDAEGEKLGMSREEIGRVHGIDEDWSRFQDTLSTLNPRSEKFGQDTADALFKTAQQHPEQALQFVQMAKDAGKLPEFREQFLQNMIKQPANRSTPTNEMEFLRSFQNSFGTSDAGKSVLAETFGKESPLANPITMSKVLGAAANPDTQTQFTRTLRQAGSQGAMLRMVAFYGLLGGSPWVAMRHPDKLPLLLGAMAGLTLAPSALSKLSAAGQRGFINMVTNPNSVEAVKNFSRVAGATITGLESTPQPSQ